MYNNRFTQSHKGLVTPKDVLVAESSPSAADLVLSSDTVFPLKALALSVALLSAPVFSVQAADLPVQHYSVPAGQLGEALSHLAGQAGVTLSFDAELTRTLKSKKLEGRFSLQDGFRQLLEGSELIVEQQADGSYLLKKRAEALKTELDKLTVKALPETATGPVKGYMARLSDTGTKTGALLVETPQSLSVITADKVRAIGATRLKEALAYTPGVNASPWGDMAQYDWLYIRGFDAYQPGFYMDGLQMRNNGNWGIWQTESYGQERIEVLRGPSSVLYGQNGPGGVVNLVSKTPQEEKKRQLELSAGNYNHKQVALDMTGPVNESGELLYRFTGLVKDAELSTADLENDRLFIAPSLTWQPSDDTRLTLLSQFIKHRSGSVWHGYPIEGTLEDNPNGSLPRSFFLGEKDFNRYHQDQWMLGYQLEHQLNNTWSLQQNLRYGEFDLDYRVVWGRLAKPDSDNPANPVNFRTFNRTPFRSDEKVSTFSVDNRAIARFSTGDVQHTLLTGLDYQLSDLDVTAFYGGSLASVDLFNPVYGAVPELNPAYIDGKTEMQQTGLYVQNQMRLTPQLIATLGGRYDWSRVENKDRLSGENTVQTDNEFTARAGLVYRMDNGLSPYLSYSQSFQPSSTVNPATGKAFSPERGRQYEAGVRYQPDHSDTLYSVAAFDLKRQDYVTWVWSGESPGPKQTGEVVVRGMEFEAYTQPVDNLNLNLSYTWMPEADVTSSVNPAEVGKQDKAVSEHQASIWADYRFQSGLKMGMGARYVGSNNGSGEEAPIKVPGYTLLDAMLGYELDQWTLALNIRNLADKNYLTTCDDRDCFAGERRKVMATVSYDW